MKAVVVLHEEKWEKLGHLGSVIASNPPLSILGFIRSHNLIEKLKPVGPFSGIFCSRLARTLEMASVFALAFDVEVESRRELGQHASREGNEVFFYPGYEKEWYEDWQRNAVGFFQGELSRLAKDHEDCTILVLTHRPILAGILCHLKGISDPEEMKVLARSGELSKKDFYVFEVSPEGKIILTK